MVAWCSYELLINTADGGDFKKNEEIRAESARNLGE